MQLLLGSKDCGAIKFVVRAGGFHVRCRVQIYNFFENQLSAFFFLPSAVKKYVLACRGLFFVQ